MAYFSDQNYMKSSSCHHLHRINLNKFKTANKGLAQSQPTSNDDVGHWCGGTGLWVAVSRLIGFAGPSVLISYAIGAVIALLLVGCLAEMTVILPQVHSVLLLSITSARLRDSWCVMPIGPQCFGDRH